MRLTEVPRRSLLVLATCTLTIIPLTVAHTGSVPPDTAGSDTAAVSALVGPSTSETNPTSTEAPAGATSIASFGADISDPDPADSFTPADRPSGLRTNLLEHATSAPADALTFSWQNPEGQQQEAYRITILKSSLAHDVVLQGGWKASEAQTSVSVDGLAEVLEDNSLYEWQVEVRYSDGRSRISEAAQFATSVGDQFVSRQFIWTAENSVANLIRAEVPGIEDGTRALLTVTALDTEASRRYVSAVYANGEEIAVGPNRRSGSDIYYNTYDITDELTSGTNTIGTYNYSQAQISGVLMQLTYFRADGSKEIVYNSGRDRARTRILKLDDVVYGISGQSIGTSYYTELAQNADTTRFPYGWWEEDGEGSSSGWQTPSASALLPMRYQLTPAITPAMVRKPVRPTSVITLGRGRYTVDFGQEIVGDIQLTATASARTGVRITLGEQLKEDGTAQYSLNTGNTYDETWTFLGSDVTFAGYSLKAFRYVTITNYPGELTANDISALSTTVPSTDRSEPLQTDQSLTNAIIGLSEHTQEEGTQEIITDSVTRERAPYEGDLLIYQDLGSVLGTDVTVTRNTWNRLLANPSQYTEYRLMSILGVHEDYMQTADTRYVESVYERLQELLETVTVDPFIGLARASGETTDLVDWTRAETPGYDFAGTTYKTAVNIFAYRAYADMADLANAIGRHGEASTYSAQARSLRAAINSRLYSSANPGFLDGVDSVGVPINHFSRQNDYLALALDVIVDSRAREALAASIATQGGQEVGSIYMAYFFYHGLARAGYRDVAIQVLLKSNADDIRTYAHVITGLGATMTPEAWSESSKANLSYSHVWGTGGGSGLYEALFGVTPTSPAYATYDVSVSLGPLTSASTEIPTVKGIVAISARRTGKGTLQVITQVPSGSVASVRIAESASTSRLIVDGRAVLPGDQVVVLQSGTHTLVLHSPTVLTTTLSDGTTSVPTLNGEANSWVTSTSGLQSIDLEGLDGSIYEASVRSEAGRWTEFGTGTAQTEDGERITAVRLRPAEPNTEGLVLLYRVLTAGHGWTEWTREGLSAGTTHQGDRIVGLQACLSQELPDAAVHQATDHLPRGRESSQSCQLMD